MMRETDFSTLVEYFIKEGFLAGITEQADILFKYTVPITVEVLPSVTVTLARDERHLFGVVNPTGVTYTYQYVDGNIDHITELYHDFTIEGIEEALVQALKR